MERDRRRLLSSAMQLGLRSARDVGPIIFVIAIFQLVVLRQPFPDLGAVLLGFLAVVLGLSLFIRGLEIGLFPLGESMANAFARRGSLFWLLVFAFALGFSTTIAEPALSAVADEASRVRADETGVSLSDPAVDRYAMGLRVMVAVSVGVALVIGVIRIVRGWPIHWFIIVGYGVIIGLTPLAPDEIVGVAYDSGGVTTSTITVPLVTALGVGLSKSIRGRNPLVDGFGLIAFASLTPIVFVLLYGMAT
ncbi:MAG: DUF1538 domain-containing protein [Thermoleophilia bacterium]|nr:DUF1538 domain-containing protein [Thermoleophilia bacterium]